MTASPGAVSAPDHVGAPDDVATSDPADSTAPASLACGRDPIALVDRVAAGGPGVLDAHERDCPYCRAALAQAEVSHRVGAEVRAGRGDPPDPSSDLVPRTMRVVRQQVRRSREIPVAGRFGPAAVTDQVVVAVLRRALDRAEGADGLAVTACRVDPDAEGGLGVRVEAWGRYGSRLTAAADAARRSVVETLDRDFGLRASAGVDVVIGDLLDPVDGR